MKALGIVNQSLVPSGYYEHCGSVNIGGTTVPLGVIDVPRPCFLSTEQNNSGYVLVRIVAFSCNYRDKALIVRSAMKCCSESPSAIPFSYFGSDFVGVIESVGPDVNSLSIGDRVIPDCCFPDAPAPGIAPGVTTNEASAGWLRLHESKLTKIPRNMNDDIAASFSIGGQTSRSLVRRSVNSSSDEILVLSARSNTSAFILATLSTYQNHVVAVTTSRWSTEERELFPEVEFKEVNHGNILAGLKTKSFDVVIDPFFDLHLPHVIRLMKSGGRYITCGYKNQHDSFDIDGKGRQWHIDRNNMLSIMVNNISIIGNCIGTKEDLQQAVSHFSQGNMAIPIDSVFSCSEGAGFLERTYNAIGRLGKAVCRLE